MIQQPTDLISTTLTVATNTWIKGLLGYSCVLLCLAGKKKKKAVESERAVLKVTLI